MPLPLVPIVAALGGLSGGLGLAQLLSPDDSKKQQAQTTTYHPYAYYQPSTSTQKIFSPQIQYPSYQTIIDSPFASQTAKKEQASEVFPEFQSLPQWTSAAPAITDTPSAAGEMTPIAIIAVIGLLGYAFLSKKK
ncbi:MAG: hypothetical protein SVM80_12645 [Halobacteriota archaeon]|jgi:hypothetical protein|nr:hypothetical protein [Halobacteriota archaeon]